MEVKDENKVKNIIVFADKKVGYKITKFIASKKFLSILVVDKESKDQRKK